MRRSYPKTWGKQFERYCDEYLPEWKTEICDRAAITGMSAMRARRQKSMRGWRKSDERKWCFKKMKSEYDNELFFNEYAKMARSQGGLRAAGEWHQLKPLFPPMQGKKVLDLGCGYGWHCKFAAEQGAEEVLGIDLSTRMLEEAKRRNADARITYRLCGIEEYKRIVNRYLGRKMIKK